MVYPAKEGHSQPAAGTSQPTRPNQDVWELIGPATPKKVQPAEGLFEEPDPLSPALTEPVVELLEQRAAEQEEAAAPQVRGRSTTRGSSSQAEEPPEEETSQVDVIEVTSRRRGYSRPRRQQPKVDVASKMASIPELSVHFLMNLLILQGPGIMFSG